MSPGDFLRAIWPNEGIYCLAIPFVPKGETKPVYAHKTFTNISDAVSHVLRERNAKDIFFAIHTLKAHHQWDPQKINTRTGEVGGNRVRTQTNMAAARCFFFDIDVGAADDKYATQAEALAGLIGFCKVAQLPVPLVASSGGGLHVYWLLGDVLESEEWRDHATKLRQLARHYGLKIDGSRTTDTASVLRVAGTFNFKDRTNPREVAVLKVGQPTATGVFIKTLDDALTRAGLEAKPVPKHNLAASILGDNTSREFDGPPVSLKALVGTCAQMQRIAMLNSRGIRMSEPEWTLGVIGLGRFLEDGHRRIHQMSQGYPGYSEAETTAKIHEKEAFRFPDGNPLPPTSCAKLAEVSGAGDEPCVGCPFAGKVKNPLQAARHKDPAPAPIVQELVGTTMVETTVPPPPKPYMLMKGGGVSFCAKDKDGNETNTVIYECNLYPIRRLSNVAAGIEQQTWRVELPRSETKDFVLDADALYDSRKFMVAIAHQGIYPHKANIPYLQDYMVAYISELQRLADADAQCTHLGWTDEYRQFIFPDKILHADGTAKPAMLGLGAQRASANVTKKGDLATQVSLMSFYDHPAYLPNQYYILNSLAAAIFFATGHHGVIVNASGEAGASKSTSLYTAASFWGQPELYPINGTNNGATVRGRNERVTVLANLPVCVDEITHMPIRDAVDLAMSITQPGHRIRLGTDGVERASVDSYKATIMLATANNSLHSMLSMDNTAGTAGSMRVFEILFKRTSVHTKAEADDFLHAIKQNFGHIGEAFMAWVVQNLDTVKARLRAKIREIDTAASIQSSERFWSADVGATIVAGEIARELGLLPFDTAPIQQWAIHAQIPYMRGVVTEEYSDPMSVIADYLNTIHGNILVMSKAHGGNLSNVQHAPRNGALLAHYDLTDHVLYVLKKGFKDHCAQIGANSLKILNDLAEGEPGQPRVVTSRHTKRTLGAGTEYAKAQAWCFAINMAHPAVTGTIDLEVVVGGKSEPTSVVRAIK